MFRSGYRSFRKRSTERAIDWFCLVCVSPFKTQWGGTNEQTKRSQSLSFRRSIWPVKNEMDGSQKSTLRKEKVSGKKWGRAPLISGADLSQTCLKKKERWRGRQGEGETRSESYSFSLPSKKQNKTKKVIMKSHTVCKCTEAVSSLPLSVY